MKIFLIGISQSGRTTVANALCENNSFQLIDALDCMQFSFRERLPKEHPQKFQEEYQLALSLKTKENPNHCIDSVKNIMNNYPDKKYLIIDNITSPRDFAHLFNINEDIVIFLNRVDNEAEYKDCDSIAVSVMRDYCFWMSSCNYLNRERWLEFNFRIPGEDSDATKMLGSRNSIYIVKNINKVILHLRELIK
jgi:adenylate kinase family enzyme